MDDQPPPHTELTDVERVARALAKDAGEHWFTCNRYRNENQRWLKAARAAIAAMPAADQPPSDDEYKLPCDVRLPPATVIKAGCSLATLKLAMELEGRPKEFRTNQPPHRPRY